MFLLPNFQLVLSIDKTKPFFWGSKLKISLATYIANKSASAIKRWIRL
ncbi:hypothetical protein NBT05_07150 [Aquimarina sp. ERC-38]|nr:hypothetical protein [Aquimarina sp. ERC-38]UZO82245.1 hypothetical protein NBT05_07150 [Aquimarina sp. ERC-38]